MRKLAACGLAATLALLAGCSGGADPGGDASGKGEVVLWMYPVIADQAKSTAYWQKVEKDFEAANQGIDLKVELQPWDGRQEKITTALAAGKGFDLVVLGPDQIPQYVQQGTLAPVDETLGADKGKFHSNALQALSVEGKLYGVPIYHTATLPAYNKDLLTKAGITEPPATWDALKAAAPKLAAQGVALFDYPGAPDVTLNLSFYPLLWQAGGSVFSTDGKAVQFNDAAGVEALQFLLDLKAAGGLPVDAATNKLTVEGSPFATGKAAIMPIAQLSNVTQLAKALGDNVVTVAEPLTGKRQVAFGLPGGVAQSKKSGNAAGARKVLTFLSSKDVISGLCKEAGFFPTRGDASLGEADATTAKFASSIDKLYPGDTHPKARQVMSVLAPHIQAALLGKKTAKQALDDAAKEAGSLLG